MRVSISLLAGELGPEVFEVEMRCADSGTALINSQPKYMENFETLDARRVLAASGHGIIPSFQLTAEHLASQQVVGSGSWMRDSRHPPSTRSCREILGRLNLGIARCVERRAIQPMG
jgi:hypothetical protein